MGAMRVAAVVLMGFACTGIADAQELVGVDSSPRLVLAATPTSHTSDVASIARVLRRVTDSDESPLRSLIAVQYLVEVHATARVAPLFTADDNLVFGQARYGAPTHRQFLDVFTPRPFRRPAADLNSLARWLSTGNRD